MQLPIASNYNILIADKRGKMVVVECTPNIKKIGEAKSVDDGYLVCTELKNFPLYCPKCKQESLIDAKNLQITVIKEPDAKTQSR